MVYEMRKDGVKEGRSVSKWLEHINSWKEKNVNKVIKKGKRKHFISKFFSFQAQSAKGFISIYTSYKCMYKSETLV